MKSFTMLKKYHILNQNAMNTPQSIILIFDDVRSAENVGAIFRTADAIGVSKIILGGITPGVTDRFGRSNPKIAKTALGAEKTISHQSIKDLVPYIRDLKIQGYTIVSLEQTPEAIDYKSYTPKEKTVLVVGNEVSGISKDILELTDTVIHIPMHGEKESLNVSVAAGVALFRVFDK